MCVTKSPLSGTSQNVPSRIHQHAHIVRQWSFWNGCAYFVWSNSSFATNQLPCKSVSTVLALGTIAPTEKFQGVTIAVHCTAAIRRILFRMTRVSDFIHEQTRDIYLRMCAKLHAHPHAKLLLIVKHNLQLPSLICICSLFRGVLLALRNPICRARLSNLSVCLDIISIEAAMESHSENESSVWFRDLLHDFFCLRSFKLIHGGRDFSLSFF